VPNALAALAAALWGGGDFLGGFAVKYLDVRRVGVLAEGVGLCAIAAVLVVAPADPSSADLAWGLGAGVAIAVGLSLLYQALAIGPMHVAAPTAALVGALTNVAIGLIDGERPGITAVIGAPLAILALVLVGSARAEGERHASRTVLFLSAGAGLAIGVTNACFAATSPSSGLWPVGGARLVALILLAGAALVQRGASSGWHPKGVRFSVAAGLTDTAATATAALAFQRGSQVLVGVLGGLFPVVTVVLARLVLREVMSRKQIVGLVCAVAAAALMAAA
jgi:drug/metabolite transporter (DMT)-like permease